MKEFSVSADLDIPAQVLFLERDSVAFRCLLAEALDLGTIEFEKQVADEAGMLKVWQKTYPRIDKYVPAGVVKFVQKYVGTLVYTDILSYDPQKLQRPPYEIEVTSIPPVFKDKTTLKSKLIIDSLGPTRCRQTLQGSVDVLMTGIGRTAEKIIVQQLAKVYESIPAVIDRWVQLRATMIEHQSSEWLLLGRPDTQIDWVLQEYSNYQKGRLPDGLVDFGNKEDLGSVGLSEEQVMQKAQAQLEREEAGLKKLPTAAQAGPAPGTANQTVVPGQPADSAAADLTAAGSTAAITRAAGSTAAGSTAAGSTAAGSTAASSTAAEQYVHDNVATSSFQEGTEDGTSATPLDRESKFVTPDRATSVEVASADEPVPCLRAAQPESAQHNSLDVVSAPPPTGTASSGMPCEALSHSNSPAHGHAGAARVSGEAARGLPVRKQRPNKFLQCITCGTGQTW